LGSGRARGRKGQILGSGRAKRKEKGKHKEAQEVTVKRKTGQEKKRGRSKLKKAEGKHDG
jgi:hypothetical protein